MSFLTEQFQEIVRRNQKMIDALRQESANLVKPLLQDFMQEHPQVKQIRWSQYTPYFNDGDQCVFGLHTVSFYFEGDDLDNEYEDVPVNYEQARGQGYWEKHDVCSPETHSACKELEAILYSSEEELRELFGDHVEVIVTPEGVEVETYDHD